MKNMAETDTGRFIEAQDNCGYTQALKEVKNGRKQITYLAGRSTLSIKTGVAQLR